MSCYEWEEGIIRIPLSEWIAFKKKIKDSYNNLLNQEYQLALRTYNYLKAAAKDKRDYDYKHNLILKIQEANVLWDSFHRIERSLFPLDGKKRKTPLKPKRKDFKLAGSRTNKFTIGDARIALITLQNCRVFTWNVPENNHAVDEAHDHPVARAAFTALAQVTWKRNSGGVIVGNNEYNQDSSEQGGGGNYVTYTYGTPMTTEYPNG